MDYAKAIRVIRAATGLSQAEFAERISKTPSLVSRLESGDRKPSSSLIEAICTEFKVPVHLFTLLASNKNANLSDDELALVSDSLLKILINIDRE
jgi:transcriptional regulator with XRE-family HTH domain